MTFLGGSRASRLSSTTPENNIMQTKYKSLSWPSSTSSAIPGATKRLAVDQSAATQPTSKNPLPTSQVGKELTSGVVVPDVATKMNLTTSLTPHRQSIQGRPTHSSAAVGEWLWDLPNASVSNSTLNSNNSLMFSSSTFSPSNNSTSGHTLKGYTSTAYTASLNGLPSSPWATSFTDPFTRYLILPN